jgi:hypothetical protein
LKKPLKSPTGFGELATDDQKNTTKTAKYPKNSKNDQKRGQKQRRISTKNTLKWHIKQPKYTKIARLTS